LTKFQSGETAAGRHAELRLSLLQASIYAIVGVQLPFFSIWLSERGLGAFEIAAVLAVQPVIRIGSMLLASRRADRRGDHGALLVGCMAAMAAAYAVMGWSSGFVALLVAGAMVALAQGPLAPLADGVTFGEARRRREAGLPQLHYSWVRGWGSMSILVFLAASGPVAGALAVEDIVWLLTMVAALSCLACLGSLIGMRSTGARAERRSGGRIARPELVALVIVAATLVQSSHSMVNTFGALHWKEQGHSDTFVAFAWVAALATEVVVFLMAARWFGGESKAGAFLLVGAIGAVLRWLLMSADPGPYGIFFAQALHGASCAAVQIGPAYLLAELGGKERLAQSQAWLAAAIAGGNSLLTFLSGPLYAQAGERAYLAMAAAAFVGLLLSCAVAHLCATRHGARAETARDAHAEPEHSSA
jgi:MFS transporter, PPP family, 3-phenylpropionic acid transporter